MREKIREANRRFDAWLDRPMPRIALNAALLAVTAALPMRGHALDWLLSLRPVT